MPELSAEAIERLERYAADFPNFVAELAELRKKVEAGGDSAEIRKELKALEARLPAAVKEASIERPTEPEPRTDRSSAEERKAGRTGYRFPWELLDDDPA